PADVRGLEAIKPIYTKLKGWKQSTENIVDFDKLPQLARDYLRFLERGTGARPDYGFAGFRPRPAIPGGIREARRKMISFTVRMKFKPEDRDEIQQALRALTVASRQEPGCATYVPHILEGDPDTIFIYEQYRDQAARDAHAASEHSRSSP